MKIIKKLIPLIIVLSGLAVLAFLTMLRPKPQKEEKIELVPIVSVQSFDMTNVKMDVSGTGLVRSSLSVNLVAQVPGTVTAVSQNMKDGGAFKKGEVLFQIDKREYELRVQSAQAEVKRQELNLAKEESESEIAKQEWANFNKNNPDARPNDLALRIPQLETAKAALESAIASLELAKLNLERTTITAPFSGRVVTRNSGAGQFAGAGAVLASIYSTEVMEVTVSVEDKMLKWIEVTEKNHPKALITADLQGKKQNWTGVVKRVSAELDSRNRLSKLIIEVYKNEGLVPNMFAEVTIEGKEFENVFSVPLKYVYDSRLLIEKNGVLEIRPVVIEGISKENAVVKEGISPADRVVTTPIRNAVNGMKVKAGEN